MSPAPTQGELTAFYESHAYRTEHGAVPICVMRHGIVEREYLPDDADYTDGLIYMGQHRADWACEHAGLVSGMRLLEVGSGDGYTLAEFAHKGLECTGIEPDREEAERSAARCPSNAKVIAAPFDAATYEPPYDAVVAFHVLEHLHDPIAALRSWREMLTPRGALIVEVPNILNPQMPVDTQHFQWVHLVDFSEYTLRATLVVAGFEVMEMVVGGNIRVLARPATSEERYAVPHGGEYVEGWLDALRSMGGKP